MGSDARLLLGIALLLAGCSSKDELPAPPPATSSPSFQPRNSTIVVPIDLQLDDLQRVLEQETPRQLWSIDQRNRKCIAGQRVKVLGEDLKVTPDVDCRIVGEVTRGAFALTGSGERLRITFPINATVSAQDIGGILKGETATAKATVVADVRFNLDAQWKPSATVSLAYDWKEPPGIDFLGQRISFAEKADEKLKRVIDQLEQSLQRQVAKAEVRPAVESAWQRGFAVIELSKRNPPAWLRLTPKGLGLTGYAVNGRVLTFTVALDALTETFVGERPPAPVPTPLGSQIPPASDTGLTFFMPVMADYAELEPVVLKALRKLAARGIRLEGVGEVKARFDKVTVYATGKDRLAVGIDAEVEPIGALAGVNYGKYKGRVWLTGRPLTEPNSQIVRISGLDLYGDTDSISGDLVILLAQSDGVRAAIGEALTQNFNKDYDKLLGKVQRSLESKQLGRFHLSVEVDQVRHDRVQVTGAGLFMPVVVTGKGQIRVD